MLAQARIAAGLWKSSGWRLAAAGALLLLALAGLIAADGRLGPLPLRLAAGGMALTILGKSLGPNSGQRAVTQPPASLGETAGENALLRAAAAEHEIASRASAAELLGARREIAAASVETEALRREVHHRVKNNLQIISSLLQLQGAFIEDPAARDAFKDSQNRITAMAFIHELLYGQAGALPRLDVAAFLRRLGESLAQSIGPGSQRVALVCQAADALALNVDQAVPCGLILNELVSRALRRGAGELDGANELRIELRAPGNGRCVLAVSASEAAAGLLPDEAEWRNLAALDLQLVSALAEQLGGRLACTREPGGGREIRLDFPQSSVLSTCEQPPAA